MDIIKDLIELQSNIQILAGGGTISNLTTTNMVNSMFKVVYTIQLYKVNKITILDTRQIFILKDALTNHKEVGKNDLNDAGILLLGILRMLQYIDQDGYMVILSMICSENK